MKTAPEARLMRLLGGEALAPLRLRLRRFFERAAAGDKEGLRLGQLSEPEHAALAALMGRPPRPTASMQVDVQAIDTALREAGIASSLRQALEQLDGPIVHQATVRSDTQLRWSSVVAGCRHQALAACLQTATGLGLLKRLARQDADAAARLCERADAVLLRLPAQGAPRAQLAAQTLGDAHALDAGQPTATLVLAALRQQIERPETDDEPETLRELWARAGVLVNELARPALFLNLPNDKHEDHGEPCYASLRRLLRSPPPWRVAGRTVYICENPNLLAIAADYLGPRCAPLVCTEGMPAAAQRCLLQQLRAAGARLLYHGDFDWPGLRIANLVLREHGAAPWRFDAAAYEAAVQAAPPSSHRLTGTPVMASWDSALAPAMQAQGLAIAEEALADGLLQDLAG